MPHACRISNSCDRIKKTEPPAAVCMCVYPFNIGICCLNFAHKSILRHKNIKWYCRTPSFKKITETHRTKKEALVSDTNKGKKKYVIEELLSHVLLCGTQLFALYMPLTHTQPTVPSPSQSHSTVSTVECENEAYIRISYQFIFLSTNPSCSTDFSHHLRLHAVEPYHLAQLCLVFLTLSLSLWFRSPVFILDSMCRFPNILYYA